MKTVSILLALTGLALITGFTAWLGLGAVLHSLGSVGPFGFAALVAAQLASDVVMAVAWAVACPRIGLYRLLRARLVREGGTTCLPFSQLGGILMGMRATCFSATRRARTIAWPEAAAANVVDLTTEVIGQILFVLLGLLFLLDHRPDSSLAGPVTIGMALMTVAIIAFIWAQRGASGTVRRGIDLLGARIAGQWRGLLQDGFDSVQERLNGFYAQPWRIVGSSLIHFVSWIMAAGWAWLGYHLLGAEIGFGEAMAIEGVASGVVSVSFLVPAALGVQEAAYVTLGSLFGIDPHLSFSLSLLRRGRDLAIGVPVLLVWQALEIRHLRKPAAAAVPGAIA
ncbi:lysylphosphatidylglycerol synthase domain-containing protein [Lichenicola sp.]|uniref:lysylphosphatidylglycerol synthase domain-containing protein n=1 Tax=Lichenicola sp. TaxID=2804529 RepID=UPI003B005E3D